MARNPPATNMLPDISSSACRSRQVSRTLALSKHTRLSPAVWTPSTAERLASGLIIRQPSYPEADADHSAPVAIDGHFAQLRGHGALNGSEHYAAFAPC